MSNFVVQPPPWEVTNNTGVSIVIPALDGSTTVVPPTGTTQVNYVSNLALPTPTGVLMANAYDAYTKPELMLRLGFYGATPVKAATTLDTSTLNAPVIRTTLNTPSAQELKQLTQKPKTSSWSSSATYATLGAVAGVAFVLIVIGIIILAQPPAAVTPSAALAAASR